ncbi:peptidoglycan DD-metalloendopeptidase family protein [Paenibacillus sp. GCM10023252]|uniref:peptidoglycan DD-metalloendopeptidase family protein n=1 Tax=Paenibacillus sp. GCM10023252 TaxID=3252649 RepID=UPI0036237181
MTVFRSNGRIRKAWDGTVQYFRGNRSQDLKGTTQQHSEPAAATPIWRSKKAVIAGGALVILAATGIGGFQYVQANTVDYYQVYRNGSAIGTVSKPEDVEQMLAQKTDQVKEANAGLQMVVEPGDITFEPKSGYKAVPATEATLTQLSELVESHAIGVEVKVNGKVVGVVKDQATADAVLARVQTKFAPSLAKTKQLAQQVRTMSYSTGASKVKPEQKKAAPPEATKPGRQMTEVAFVEKVQMGEAEIDPAKIKDAEEVYKLLIQGSVKPTKYTIQEGDCIGCIAQKFNISPQVIYENNPWIVDDQIKAGDVLDLTVLQPEVTVKTVENVTESVTIEAPQEIRKNAAMKLGESKTIQEGVDGEKHLTYRVVKQNGYEMSEDLVSTKVVKEAIPTIILKGTKVILGEGSGRFAMPVAGGRISSKFGQRWGKLHKGIDLTGSRSILAADNGVVEFAGKKNGYGMTVIINHKNGFKTLYGHMSSINVKRGATVGKGAKIGVMGSTGHSTGVHLHFEIYKNGVLKNPLSYL